MNFVLHNQKYNEFGDFKEEEEDNDGDDDDKDNGQVTYR